MISDPGFAPEDVVSVPALKARLKLYLETLMKRHRKAKEDAARTKKKLSKKDRI